MRLYASGDYQQARTLEEEEDTLTRRRRVLGERPPRDPLLGQQPRERPGRVGDYQQARTLHEDTLTRYRRVLGEDHPDTRRSERNLAEVLRKLDEGAPS